MRDTDFFPAIFDRPTDDGPRMVYADWLASREDPRGEFIVLQCELARSPPSDRAARLEARAKELLSAYAHAWTHGLWPDRAHFEFHRGFAVLASMSAQTLLGHVDQVFGSGPIETLKLRGVGGAEARALGRVPHLVRAHRLDFGSNRLGPGACAALREACLRPVADVAPVGHERLLHTLDLRGNRLDDDALEALLHGLAPARATHLDLSFNRLGNEGVARLAEAASLMPSLERLVLVEVGAGADAARTLRAAFGDRAYVANARGS